MNRSSLQPGIPGLYNVSYFEREVDEEIRTKVGKAYGFFRSVRMGGTGSPRMIISEASETIRPLLGLDKNMKYCIIEIRPNGLIIRFRIRLDALAFVISFRELQIKNIQDGYTLIGNSGFLHLIPFKNEEKVRAFFQRIDVLKN